MPIAKGCIIGVVTAGTISPKAKQLFSENRGQTTFSQSK